ncbi:prepilin-type N-terminal cleavage/methylation domain-containing protein [Pseudomonas sp. PDM18]|uniref:PilW family protein n=1 Tax=Pseudomonas sp. PDM18 TaxID=2769253 RepID=UPI00177CD135|nr:type II secretion system protein [Pseudomonas sp. PDM18]MBD9676890.1 prepilin-type N-terminal cleavage/methylation domain-containing protein [Pseudomonas sp. PDM18]
MPRQQGFSLIELMVAIVLASLLILGVTQLYSNSAATDRTNSALARVQESGRTVLELIRQDTWRAGFEGCINPLTLTKVGNVTFPDDTVIAQTNPLGVTLRYASRDNTGTSFPQKDCDNSQLYLHEVTYANCSGNQAGICVTSNGGAATQLTADVTISAIRYGVPNKAGTSVTWKDSPVAEDLPRTTALQVSVRATDTKQEITRDFSSTVMIRNRSQ